jgi:hypothetical protein
MVERCIKHRDLRNSRHSFPTCVDTHQIRRNVQRRETYTVFKGFKHIFIYQCTLDKLAPAVYHPMSYGIYLGKAVNNAKIGTCQLLDYGTYCFSMCGKRNITVEYRFAVRNRGVLQMTVNPYAIAHAFCENILRVRIKELILER